jgi:probable rRNA maturation factor
MRAAKALPRRRGREKTIKPLVDVMVRSARWRRQPGAAGIVRRAVATAAQAASTRTAGLAIVLCDDSAIRALNREWRGLNAPTNVLSFPTNAGRTVPRERPHIGDIVIAYETTAREATAEGKPFAHHLAHLAVHGYLHLLGFDHETDRDAKTMERLEVDILARLDVPDPYAPRRVPI